MPQGVFSNPVERSRKLSEKLKGKPKTEGSFKKGHPQLNGGKTPFKKGLPPAKHKMGCNCMRCNPSLYKGEKCPNWKGGVSTTNELIRHSQEYKLWRISVFERDGYMCIWGGKDHGKKLHADHIKPFSLFPELRFAIDNGRTLCEKCHRSTDTWGNNNKNKVNK